MKMEFEVELTDRPGELSRLLNVVAQHGGNVFAVLHHHERAVEGRVPVACTVEVPEAQALRLIDALARSHRLLRVDRHGGPSRTAVLLTGHVFEADIRKLFDAIFEAGAEVEEMDARISGRANPSAVLAQLTAKDAGTLDRALEGLRSKAKAGRITVIEQVEGERLG